MTDAFVLDLDANPHPKMLAGAIQARRTARAIGGADNTYYWCGYVQAMADATGESVDAINAWVDRHEAT